MRILTSRASKIRQRIFSCNCGSYIFFQVGCQYSFCLQHVIQQLYFRMANLVKKQAADQSFSLLQLMERVQDMDENECKAKAEPKIFNNPIIDGLQKINVKKEKKIIEPTFEPEKIVIQKRNTAGNFQKKSINLPFQRSSSPIIPKPNEKESYNNYNLKKVSGRQRSIYDKNIKCANNDQDGKTIFPKEENRQFQTRVERSPINIIDYPITFHQSMNLKGVELNISFGSYKHYYSNWRQKCAMVVFFSEVNEKNTEVSYFLDLQGRQGTQFIEQMQQGEKYNYIRTGEVKTYNKKNSSYDKIYFVKTPNKNVQAHLFSNQIKQSIGKLVQTAAIHEIECLKLSWLRWGRVKSKECAYQMLDGIVKKVNSLEGKKSLKLIRICLKSLAQYEIYSAQFRQLSDEYMKAFYRD